MGDTTSPPSDPGPFLKRFQRPVTLNAHLVALWPALAAVALFLAMIGYDIAVIKSQEGGRYVYVIDDAYGHLATARNLAQHGVWTYNYANGFESSVSSLIWPVIIAACFLVFGVHDCIPLVLNLVAVVATLFYLNALLRRATGSSLLSLLVLGITVIFTPLTAVAATGMEHSLQILLDLAFVDLAARLLMDDSAQATTARTPRWLCVVGLLVVLTRYEGLFLIAAVGLLLLCRRRWKLAILLGVVSTTPTVLFGLFSLSQGWHFLPDSLLLKGNVSVIWTVPGVLFYFGKAYRTMVSEQHMPALVAAAVVTLLATLQGRCRLWTYPVLVMLITVLALWQQLQFAAIGWFYRYEAYLIVLVFFGIGVALGNARPAGGWRYWLRPAAIPHVGTLALAGAFLLVPFWSRTDNVSHYIIAASYSIYGQQYQMGRFVRRFYSHEGVIANDVCAISFLGNDVRLLDFVGLSNVETLRLRLGGKLDQEAMRRLSREHHSDIAILYDDWAGYMFGGILPEWVKVATWTIPHNAIAAGDTVSFYAISQDKVPALVRALQEFAPALPPDIRQEGLYRGPESLCPLDVYLPPGGGKEALHYWSRETARLTIYPAQEPTANAPLATINLGVFPAAFGPIDIYFNDELVETKVVAPAEVMNWLTVPVPVRWKPGQNVIKLVGHGRASAILSWDPRPVLFAVLDPRRMLTAAGTTAQPGVAQAKQ